MYLQTLSCKDFLRDTAGEASRDCDGDGRERKEGCAKEIAGAEFRIVFVCDGTDKAPDSREVRGRRKVATIKDEMGLMAAIAVCVYEPIRKSGLLAKLVYCGRRRSVLYCSFTLTNFFEAVIVAMGTLS